MTDELALAMQAVPQDQPQYAVLVVFKNGTSLSRTFGTLGDAQDCVRAHEAPGVRVVMHVTGGKA